MSSESNTAPLTIDLDDPDFQSPQQYDPLVDMDVRVPPPEIDAQGNVIDYIIRLSIGENKQGFKKPYAKVNKKEQKYIALDVKARIVADGEVYDGAFVQFPFGGVSTNPFNGTNSMVNLARLLGEPLQSNLSQIDQAAALTALLEGEPLLGGRIQWSGYCTSCEEDKPSLLGEKRWPEKKDAEGNIIEGHLSLTDCPDCGGEITTKIQIKRLFPKN